MVGRTIIWLLFMVVIIALLVTALLRSELLIKRIEAPIGETRDHLRGIEAKLLAIESGLDGMEGRITEISEHTRAITQQLEPINRGIAGGSAELAGELDRTRRWLDNRMLLTLIFALVALWMVEI